MAALTNSEGKTLLHSDRVDQLDGHLNVITRHAHLSAFRKRDNAGNISSSEIELRTIVIEERGMTTTLILGQNVNLRGELCVAGNGAGFCNNLALLDISSVDTTKKDTDVITSLSEVKQLVEHLKTCSNGGLNVIGDTKDLNRLVQLQSTTLYTSGSNGSTTGDGEYILNRHQERLIVITNRSRDMLINDVEQLHDLVAPRTIRILKSLQSRTTNDRGITESVLVKELGNFHLNQLDQLIIINHIALVQEHNHSRNADLTCKENVLTGLSHNTIGSSYNKDSAIHLCGSGDHVLYIVSMSRAVNVCIVTGLGLILNVSGIDSDTTLSLFRCFIDIGKVYDLVLIGRLSCSQYLGDSCGKSGFAMVYMSNGTNVAVRFGSVKFLFCHCNTSSLKSLRLRGAAYYSFFLMLTDQMIYFLSSQTANRNYISFPHCLQAEKPCSSVLITSRSSCHRELYPERSSEPFHSDQRTSSSYHVPVSWNEGLWNSRTSLPAERSP